MKFREIIEGGAVTAVFMGHEHHYGHYEIGGIHSIVSAGGGGRQSTETENNYHHYMRLRVGPGLFEFEPVKI